MLSFMEARGGGTSLLSSTLMAPVGILFKHYKQLYYICSTVDGSNKATYLVNDAQTLAEFLNSAKIAIVAVAILADRDIKLDLEEKGVGRCNNKTQWHRHTSSYLSYG